MTTQRKKPSASSRSTTYLRIEGAPGVAEVVGAAEDEAGQDLLLLDALQPQLQVLSGSGVVRLHVVAEQAQNLHRVLQPQGGEDEREPLRGRRNATFPQRALTLLGIMTSCWALLMEPDSSFPRMTVPMSWEETENRHFSQLGKFLAHKKCVSEILALFKCVCVKVGGVNEGSNTPNCKHPQVDGQILSK